MKIFEARVELTRQLKQYESDKVGLSGVIEDGDNVLECIEVLKQLCLGNQVDNIPGGGKSEVSLKQLELPIEKAPIAAKKAPTTKKATEEKPKVEEAKVEEASTKAEETKVEEPKKKKAAPASKFIVYDRQNDLHKKHVGTLLDNNFHGWRKDDKLKEICKNVSVQLEGKDLMDSKGEILQSFIEELVKAVKSAK
jgi:hypothetical protein